MKKVSARCTICTTNTGVATQVSFLSRRLYGAEGIASFLS